jgi:pyruvate,water dikinase
MMADADAYVRWLADLGAGDVGQVGGKNASLGEMIQKLRGAEINVPDGFATTAAAYREFLDANDLRGRIAARLDGLKRKKTTLAKTGQAIRQLFLHGQWPPAIAAAITEAYLELGRRAGKANLDVAVRSARRPRTSPRRASRASRRPFSACREKRRCSAPAADASPRSSPIAPSPTGRRTASTT